MAPSECLKQARVEVRRVRGIVCRIVVGYLCAIAMTTPLIAQQAGEPSAVAEPADTLQAAPDTVAADTVPERPSLTASADSVLRSLRELEGYTVTEYHGQTATYRATEGVLRLEGNAEVIREGDRLTADTIIYRDRQELVQAYGQPRVFGSEQEIQGNVLFYDLATRRATALGARTEVQQEVTWYVQGDMTVEGADRLFGSHARFTSCSLEIPHYHFESDEVMVLRDQILVARPARLYFGDVPVMVLPFVVHNLEQGRRSGFLTPRFGMHDIVRTSSGYNRQISNLGFYWAINQYMGAEVSTTWRSGAYTALHGSLDYRWRQQFLDGSLGVQRYWRGDGRRELSFDTRSSWRPDEVTSLSVTGRYASSADFVREASYDPREVTQDLMSNFSLRRQFGWGSASLGAQRRQSIASGDVSMTLPSFSISPQQLTLFRSATPEQARWYSNATFTPGVITGSRSLSDYASNERNRDQERSQLRAAPSFSIGNFRVNATGQVNQSRIQEAQGETDEGEVIELPAYGEDEVEWSLAAQYQQNLIGTTSIAPSIRLSQDLLRDPDTGNEFLEAPTRLSFGASLNTDLYGFFPGVGNFSAIRHRMSPRLSYSYAPEVEQTPLQEEIFGRAGGRAQNRVTLGINQTWEAKLRTPREPEMEPADTVPGDTIGTRSIANEPSDPEKVTLLSLTTSAFEYDFIRAREEGSGFLTNMVSNSISSDYLRGLRIQMQHELFDRSELDPNEPGSAGRLGRFAPQLSSLSTSFDLGPRTALIQWLTGLTSTFGRQDADTPGEGGVIPGPPEDDSATPAEDPTATGNPQRAGSGPWEVSLSYRFSRPSRNFSQNATLTNQAVQTLRADTQFQLSPNWSVTWSTDYSITDSEFGAHRLNFRRDLHEWQANFSFYQTPTGNTAFEFYVELMHNRDVRFDYQERNLGIDRR